MRRRSPKQARLYVERRAFVNAFLRGKACEAIGVAPGQCFGELTVNEVLRRSAGGAIVPGPKADAQQQVFQALCVGHHSYVTDHPKWARENGFQKGRWK
jgi:hypothetical protein